MWFADLGLADIDQVGGKNASLGEMCDPAVKSLISSAISACKSRGRYVRRDLRTGPNDHPDLAEWL